MRTTDWVWLILLLVWPAVAWPQVVMPGSLPEGPFADDECVACHADHDAQRMETQREGPHRAIGCSACHGGRHGNLSAARADATCVTCHEGAEVASHENSKHGVLLRIEPPDWSAPLQRGRYRAPGCAYCHLHDGDHGDRMDLARGTDRVAWVCGGCHSPRFAMTQLTAGQRLVAVADLKLREAEGIANCLAGGESELDELMSSARHHARNVRLGAGHQSPDYQWWYGQPALDGDLIRLRDRVVSARRTVSSTSGSTDNTVNIQPGKRKGPDPDC